jgi:hypothetical protein
MNRVYRVKCQKAGLITCVCVETPRVMAWQDRKRERAWEPRQSSPEISKPAEQDAKPPPTV